MLNNFLEVQENVVPSHQMLAGWSSWLESTGHSPPAYNALVNLLWPEDEAGLQGTLHQKPGGAEQAWIYSARDDASSVPANGARLSLCWFTFYGKRGATVLQSH